MKNPICPQFLRSALLAAAALLLSPASGYAQLFHVSIATSALSLPANAASAPFSLGFQLNSGATLNNNSATLSNFTFGGGGPLGSASLFGGASGSLSSSVTLNDATPFNEFFQGFAPGSILGFDVALTQNADAGPTPDGFSIALLDNLLGNIPTSGFANQLFSVDLPGSFSSFQTFVGTGNFSGITVSIAAVPEPSTYGAIAGGLMLVVIVTRRLRRRSVAKITLAA